VRIERSGVEAETSIRSSQGQLDEMFSNGLRVVSSLSERDILASKWMERVEPRERKASACISRIMYLQDYVSRRSLEADALEH